MSGVRRVGVLLLAALCAGCSGVVQSQSSKGTGGCLASAVSQALGKTRLLVGARIDSNEPNVFAAAPTLDIRYQYESGYLPNAVSACGSCSNPNCSGNWWGCYGSTPGSELRGFISDTARKGTVPMVTFDEFRYAAGADSTDADLAAIKNVSVLKSYMDDLRFLLQQFGNSTGILHLEPDFWGNLEYSGTAATQIPAVVTTANPTDCGAMPNTAAGLGQCMISMARKYAPKTLVGLHASAWSTGTDCTNNSDPSLDVVAEAKKTAAFLVACGAASGDFIVVETLDRDAGAVAGGVGFWDVTNQKLPNFHQAFSWAKTIAEGVGRPLLWWQTPVGNMSLPSYNQDNRVDYFFSHMNELVAAHSAAVVFGAGQGDAAWIDTSPSTCSSTRVSDHGYCLGKLGAYLQTGGVAVCP